MGKRFREESLWKTRKREGEKKENKKGNKCYKIDKLKVENRHWTEVLDMQNRDMVEEENKEKEINDITKGNPEWIGERDQRIHRGRENQAHGDEEGTSQRASDDEGSPCQGARRDG